MISDPSISNLEDKNILDYGGVSAIQAKNRAPVKFEVLAVENKDGTFRDKEVARFFMPNGDEFVREIREVDKKNYPQQYDAFQKGQAQIPTGTLLKTWKHKFLTPAMLRNLELHNILTVEQLASMPDTTVQNIGMGATELKKDATAFVEGSSASKELDELRAQNKELMERLSALESQLEATPKRKARKKVADGDTSSDNSGHNE